MNRCRAMPVLLLVAVLPAGCGPGGKPTESAAQSPADAGATRAYWEGVAGAARRADTSGKGNDRPATVAGVKWVLDRGATALRSATGEVRSLPVLGVDPEAVAHAARVTDLWARTAALTEELGEFVVGIKAFRDDATSAGVLVESFVRGMAEDPFGKTRELQAGDAELRGRWRVLEQRKKALVDEDARLEADEMALRSRLSGRYRLDFPRLAGEGTAPATPSPGPAKAGDGHPLRPRTAPPGPTPRDGGNKPRGSFTLSTDPERRKQAEERFALELDIRFRTAALSDGKVMVIRNDGTVTSPTLKVRLLRPAPATGGSRLMGRPAAPSARLVAEKVVTEGLPVGRTTEVGWLELGQDILPGDTVDVVVGSHGLRSVTAPR